MASKKLDMSLRKRESSPRCSCEMPSPEIRKNGLEFLLVSVKNILDNF